MMQQVRKRYPLNWEQLAQACKERANWRCEECGIEQFAIAIYKRGTPYFIYLHSANINHDKGNPEPELKALCISCHAKLDYQHKEREARVRLETLKQLKLLIERGIVNITYVEI